LLTFCSTLGIKRGKVSHYQYLLQGIDIQPTMGLLSLDVSAIRRTQNWPYTKLNKPIVLYVMDESRPILTYTVRPTW